MIAAMIERPPGTDMATEALGLLGRDLHPQVLRAVGGLRLALELSDARDLVLARIETSCPEIILVDTDLIGCPADLCRFARSLRADVRVLAVAYYWSDREESLLSCADVIVHKPPREAEWTAALRSVGVRGVKPDA